MTLCEHEDELIDIETLPKDKYTANTIYILQCMRCGRIDEQPS